MIIQQSPESLSHIADAIRRSGVIAFRTDTFYGLGANPFDAAAVQRIKDLKGREENKPILVLISDEQEIDRVITQRTAACDRLMKKFWPGPLTIIGEAASTLPAELTAGTKTVGVRLPNDDRVRALVRACSGVLTATSANPSGAAPARTAGEVESYFGENVDLIVDGGVSKADQSSTVIDAASDQITLVREGVILWADVRLALTQD